MVNLRILKDRSVLNYVLWLFGFLIGFTIAWNAPLQSGGYFFPPSIAGILISSLLPVALALLFSGCKLTTALHILTGFQGLFFGFSLLAFVRIYNGGIAVIRVIYLLSQSCSSLCILYIGATQQYRNRYYLKRFSMLCMFSICIICLLHYLILMKGPLWICWI